MSTTSVPTQTIPRPSTKQRWGLGIAALLSLTNLPSAFVPTPDGEVGPPYVVLLVGTLLGVVGLVGVVIAWRTGSRAATRVVAACLVVMVLTSLPALFVDVPAALKAAVALSLVVTLASLVLMFSGDRRRASDLA
jgi:4-amino-4-deoxy-L-arabinose transferase-like glycosyltransferase